VCGIWALASPAFAQETDPAVRMVQEAEAVRARQMEGVGRATGQVHGGVQGAIRDAYITHPSKPGTMTKIKDLPKRGGPLDQPWLPWVAGALGGLGCLVLLRKLWKSLA